MKLEDLQPNVAVRGIFPEALVTIVSVRWYGDNALELTYKDPGGRVSNEVLYRADEARLAVAEKGKPWSFDGDGKLFRLVAEGTAGVARQQSASLPKHPGVPRGRQSEDAGPRRGRSAIPVRRFFGTATFDPTRVGRDAGRIAEEVIAHLVGLAGAEVTVRLEIAADLPQGASDQVVRTVSENSRTLKFDSHSFERE